MPGSDRKVAHEGMLPLRIDVALRKQRGPNRRGLT